MIAWLREIRSGERPYALEEVKRRVVERARARLDYDLLRVDFRADRFEFLTGDRS